MIDFFDDARFDRKTFKWSSTKNILKIINFHCKLATDSDSEAEDGF